LGRINPETGTLFELDPDINLDEAVQAQTIVGDKLC
jgi:hypothetical protein